MHKGSYYSAALKYDDVAERIRKSSSPIDRGTYIIHARGTHFYKIGQSDRIDGRLYELQSASPLALKLVAVSASLSLESELHEKYRTWRIRGEWFRLEDDQINDLIESYGLIQMV
jgi:hypothetical protein